METSTRYTQMAYATGKQLQIDSGELLGQYWNISADAMALSDAEGIVLAVNQAYSNLYGYSVDELVGKDFAVIFPEEGRVTARRQYREIFGHGAPLTVFETDVCRADGQMRRVESRIGFIEAGGTRIAMLSSIRDVTRRWQAELELLALNEALEARVLERT